MNYGILIVSHVQEIANGVSRLLSQVAPNVSITVSGGLENNEIGTQLDAISAAIEANNADELLVFYDLGSAKMNLALASEFGSKKLHIYDTALVESAYVAASLLQANVELTEIEEQLKPLKVKGG